MNVTEPLEGETKYSPKYIYRQIFGTKMKGHHQSWPDIDLGELKEINPDTVGWIRMDNSPINYPVVKCSRSRDYCLTHNFSGEESYHGMVAMDFRTDGALGERTTILRAHHMKDGSMFFSVAQLSSEDYYETHNGLFLMLEDGLYRADFFAVHYIDCGDIEPIRTCFADDADYADWLSMRRERALYAIPLVPTVDDRVLVLTTCVSPREIAAYAVLRKEGGAAIRTSENTHDEEPELLRLVNSWNVLPEDYAPQLTELEAGIQIDPRCAPWLAKLLEDCRAAGGRPYLASAYRSPQLQKIIFEEKTAAFMEELGFDCRLAMGAAAWSVAPPGASEHELGLAVDISVEADEPSISPSFTFNWLAENAWRYGFILRYPPGKEDVTGVLYEPWHYRFVGKERAGEITASGLTLEEYIDQYYKQERETRKCLKV